MSNSSSARTCWRAPNASDVLLFRSRYNWEFIPHTHDATTVLIVTDGAVEVGVGANRYITEKGQIAIIGANQVHSARPVMSGGVGDAQSSPAVIRNFDCNFTIGRPVRQDAFHGPGAFDWFIGFDVLGTAPLYGKDGLQS
jgi:hypothetical protein